MAERVRVVIVGARFGGLTALHWLARKARLGECAVTVVDPQAVSVFRPSLIVALQGEPGRLRPLRVPVADVCRRLGARWIQDFAVRIDAAARQVHLAAHPPLSYDLCLWATGVDPCWQFIDGLDPSRGGLCELPLARATAERLAAWRGGRWVFATGPLVADPAQQPSLRAALDAAVVEAACCADAGLRRRGRREATEIWFLTPAAVAGEWLGARSQALLARELARRDIRVLTGVDVRRVEAGRLVLADRTLKVDAMTWVPPYRGSRLARWSRLDDGWGWVPTDAVGRHVEWPRLYAIGDIRRDGLPKSAHSAMRHARIAVTHALASVRGTTAPPPAMPAVLHVLDLGDGRGLFSAQNTLYGGRLDRAAIGRWAAWAKSAFTWAYLRGRGWLPVMP
ncbi:MAG: FAD-dependent oxidoreductase [Actinomycetia bacterium]|nr:FAD-dependent oxidoreductase [Actinomycetes bacterium]